MANSLGYIACFTIAVLCSVHAAQALSIIPWPMPKCGPVCAIACPCGNEVDYKGCPTCSCRPCDGSLCPLRKCSEVCPHGTVEFLGCPTCICKKPPKCPDLSNCHIKCTYGQKIENGCLVCNCNHRPLCPERLFCKRWCPNGFRFVNGCETCDCNPIIDLPTLPPSPCERVLCPLVHNCPFGFKKDKHGCILKTCECNFLLEI